jgi:5-methylcytosine-specific restriction protein B
MKKRVWFIILLLTGFSVLTYFLFSDELDPVWVEMDQLLAEGSTSKSQLQQSLWEIHLTHNPKSDHTPETLLNLTEDYLGFDLNYLQVEDLNILSKKLASAPKRIIVEGVTGAGNTTMVKTLASIIAGERENILDLDCVQNFELRLNSAYIGTQSDDGWEKGLFLQFLDSAKNNPNENYVFVIHDVDRIYPETFFGPVLWRELEDRSNAYDNFIEDVEVSIPSNLFIISNKHEGSLSSHHLNAQHFNRLGPVYELDIDPNALAFNLKYKVDNHEISEAHRKKLVYFYIKANQIIEKKYSKEFTLGQWSNLKDLYREDQFDDYIYTFISHVNSFRLDDPLKLSDFDEILNAMNDEGVLDKSSLFDVTYQKIIEWGILAEFIVGITFILTSGILTRYYFHRRRMHMHRLLNEIDDFLIIDNINSQDIIEKKVEIRKLVEKGKITHSEANFLWSYMNELIQNRFKESATSTPTR